MDWEDEMEVVRVGVDCLLGLIDKVGGERASVGMGVRRVDSRKKELFTLASRRIKGELIFGTGGLLFLKQAEELSQLRDRVLNIARDVIIGPRSARVQAQHN
jgi:hypothetical protein